MAEDPENDLGRVVTMKEDFDIIFDGKNIKWIPIDDSDAKEINQLNERTKLQIAAVMGLKGTPEQQEEAREFLKDKIGWTHVEIKRNG